MITEINKSKCTVLYIKIISYAVVLWCNLDKEFRIGFTRTVKWSVQMCRSVTVTQRAVLNTMMNFYGTQSLRNAGTYGRRQETEQALFNDTVLHRN